MYSEIYRDLWKIGDNIMLTETVLCVHKVMVGIVNLLLHKIVKRGMEGLYPTVE